MRDAIRTVAVVTVLAGFACGGSSGGEPTPAISLLTPANIDTGSPAFTLQVDGTGFAADAIVRWNGSPRLTTYVNSSLLLAQISAGDVDTPGYAQVTVTSPSAGSRSSPATFQISMQPTPSLFSLSPSSVVAGAGDLTLQVNGGAFIGTSLVRWNGSPRITTFVNSGMLQAQIPAADVATAGTAQVAVQNGPGGEPSTALPFEIRAP